ncbi:MAG: ATP-binding cassette domain-containing protein [Flavobacteriales bacterium]|nr:ATP-binding cassette domain-containing protein [Flavobacteriales bacterium]
MSERILKALMQLFAIIARVEDEDEPEADSETPQGGGRRIVEIFLKSQLNQELVDEYLKLFDEYLETHQGKSQKKDGAKKRTSVNSVKVLRICTQINEELAQKQKIIVLVRILEFINENLSITEQELEFASTVAETFNISDEEFRRCKNFVDNKEDQIEDGSHLLYINNSKESIFLEAKHIYSEGIQGQIRVVRINSVGIYFLRYYGNSEIYLNGINITPLRVYILTQGSSIRSSRVQPIYYSDIISKFLSDTTTSKIVFKVDNIMYHFKGGKIGLHPLSFSEESGKLLGIMGGSGAGKSTLLNVLNGNYPPTQGAITVNGVDIYKESSKIEGVIGYVSQDDLLIEELTVFQNLFYNAKLCFGNMSDAQITKLVLNLLTALGLYETKDLRVGNPLDKTISGGQRKRLNIGLELIREPSVLFVDEPTSGLSSRDSENIMDLLKELALKGKLVWVVIHQPSSDIFKMFDKLMILDVGGYPIYYGNPVDAVIYFKTQVNHVNCNESECPTCGNVNPEQIFNIIESKVVDEYGNATQNRKISPKEWNEFYLEKIASKLPEAPPQKDIPESTFKIPNKLKQYWVYLVRDVLSKLTNQQYVLINLFEAPALALILAFFVKFFDNESAQSGHYVFRDSENVPQFLFISVVVALFIGLTVAAEEIIKDQKILKRESFLNLSKWSYLNSKITIMFLISAIQMLLYVVVGNFILEIQGMTFTHWFALFSVACFANILGLNISASFNSAKVIYILIPILIIPQLLFSGVIVRFDKLHPWFSSQSKVPLVGNVMASRWAYEAMAVAQFKDNKFEKQFFNYTKTSKFATWKKDWWMKELDKYVQEVKLNMANPDAEAKELVKENLIILQNEIKREMAFIKAIVHPMVDDLTPEKVNENVLVETEVYLGKLKKHYKNVYKESSNKLDSVKREMTKTPELNEAFLKEQDEYTNQSLTNFVTNRNDLKPIVVENGYLVQKSDPIYLDPYDKGFLESHFYAPRKRLFGSYIDTFWANMMVIWLMSLTLTIALYFDLLKKLLNIGSLLSGIIPKKKKKS